MTMGRWCELTTLLHKGSGSPYRDRRRRAKFFADENASRKPFDTATVQCFYSDKIQRPLLERLSGAMVLQLLETLGFPSEEGFF